MVAVADVNHFSLQAHFQRVSPSSSYQKSSVPLSFSKRLSASSLVRPSATLCCFRSSSVRSSHSALSLETTLNVSGFSLDLLRVSGGEPTLGKQHLLKLSEVLRGSGYRFILETNGIPLAYDEDYAESLSKYDFVHVRVSLKGCNEEEFTMLTGAKREGFNLQLKALEKLMDARVSCHPAVIVSFSTKESFQILVQRIRQISPSLAEGMDI